MDRLSLVKALTLLPLLASLAIATGTSGTCSKTKKCETGCCSKAGYCGFGPKFCGENVCISDCDAQAECGPYAPVANTTCPLNVCCSQFGFCGTTTEFCGDGCISGCDAVDEPSCSGTSSGGIYAGYYEAWNYERSCDVITPSDIDVTPWTHLYYSFANIDTSDYTIELVYDHDDAYIRQMMDLKNKKPNLKVFLSVGGWDLGGAPFSNMVRFSGARKTFIDSATSFMKKWGFDGIDLDWEYPAASDRGGRDEDTRNFVQLVKELKDAFDGSYNITATLPSSYWYLKGFDVKGMSEYVDYFNFMSYDIHGTWDGESEYTSPDINPHTNLTEISEGLDLLWRNDVDPGKVLLGLGFYGRSFTLNDTSCTTPGCQFDRVFDNGGGTPGKCTDTSGILSNYEINDILTTYDPKVVYNEAAAVNWITWLDNQWVSFDNAKTLKQKADFANSKCLGGMFAWSLDQGGPGSLANPNNLNASDTSMEGADVDGGSDGTGDLYVATEVLNPDSNTATGIAPLNIIVAPSTLSTMTTFSIEPLVTPIEVVWTTTKTVTVSGKPTVTTTVTRTVETTTFSIPAITTSLIPWWNWNITGNATKSSTTLFLSFTLDPITFQDSPDPVTATTGSPTPMSHTITGHRTLFPPPWPWSTTSLPVKVPTPTITFQEGGPPGPTCTSGCGTKCLAFCDTPCLLDCTDPESTEGWDDPEDPDPPNHSTCSGSDCGDGDDDDDCTGPYCVKKGCQGTGCDPETWVCLDDDCEETGCRGDDCKPSGKCEGDDCQTVGCYGSDCNGKGLCIGLDCISLGCIGPLCNTETGMCTGYDCHKVTCTGPNCRDGVCSGEGCESEDNDCETENADVCTEYVYSYTDSSTTTLTTETSTKCETITACYAEATTTTTTIDTSETGASPYIAYDYTADSSALASASSMLESEFSAFWTTPTPTTTSTTSTSSSSTSTTSASTTNPHTPAESTKTCGHGKTMCHLFVSDLRSFCDEAKTYLRYDDYYGGADDTVADSVCYTDESHANAGCRIQIFGPDNDGNKCSIKGSIMEAAYDHLFDDCDHACGHIDFDNGCWMDVNYTEFCYTTND